MSISATCTSENIANITACYIPSSVIWCDVGSTCALTGNSYNSDCAFTGVADQFLSKLTALSFRCFQMVKSCVPDETAAYEQECDVIFGKSYDYGNMSDYWTFNRIYNTDTVSALYKSGVSYKPWDFLQPFSASLWILILVTMFVLTPIVMSIVEYDTGETVAHNFVKYLPDSVHAHSGIDLLNNDLPTKNTSYVLSIFVSIFAFITISLYASNLTAFVLYNNNVSPLDKIHRGMKVYVEESVYSVLSIDNSIPVHFTEIPDLHDSGEFDFIVAENYLLRNIKTCADSMVPLKGIGLSKYMFIAKKFGEENIKKMTYNIRSIEYSFDASRELCEDIAKPITLGSVYGIFIIFLCPAIIIAIIVLIRYFMSPRILV